MGFLDELVGVGQRRRVEAYRGVEEFIDSYLERLSRKHGVVKPSWTFDITVAHGPAEFIPSVWTPTVVLHPAFKWRWVRDPEKTEKFLTYFLAHEFGHHIAGGRGWTTEEEVVRFAETESGIRHEEAARWWYAGER